jgi:hypothetical protein
MQSIINCNPVEYLAGKNIDNIITGNTPIPGIPVLFIPIKTALIIKIKS